MQCLFPFWVDLKSLTLLNIHFFFFFFFCWATSDGELTGTDMQSVRRGRAVWNNEHCSCQGGIGSLWFYEIFISAHIRVRVNWTSTHYKVTWLKPIGVNFFSLQNPMSVNLFQAFPKWLHLLYIQYSPWSLLQSKSTLGLQNAWTCWCACPGYQFPGAVELFWRESAWSHWALVLLSISY